MWNEDLRANWESCVQCSCLLIAQIVAKECLAICTMEWFHNGAKFLHHKCHISWIVRKSSKMLIKNEFMNQLIWIGIDLYKVAYRSITQVPRIWPGFESYSLVTKILLLSKYYLNLHELDNLIEIDLIYCKQIFRLWKEDLRARLESCIRCCCVIIRQIVTNDFTMDLIFCTINATFHETVRKSSEILFEREFMNRIWIGIGEVRISQFVY